MKSKEFNPNRLIFARLRRGYTQKKIADELGVSTRTLRSYESGDSEPNMDMISKIFKMPKSFFYGDNFEEISDHAVSFRALSRMTKTDKDRAKTAGNIAFHFNKWLEKKFNLPKPNIPDLSMYSPEKAAVLLREEWGIADKSIDNVTALLEKNGVRVFYLEVSKDVDAFCSWDGNQPFVFLSTDKTPERSRFDAAHELGHLVRDQHSMFTGKSDVDARKIESEANAFASAFLMPETSLRRRVPQFVTVDILIELKKNWGVSVAALAYRLNKLGLISEWVYTRVLSPEIAKKGYRINEPNEMKRDESLLLDQVRSFLERDGISLQSIANELNISKKDLQEILYKYSNETELRVISNENLVKSVSKRRPNLKIIN